MVKEKIKKHDMIQAITNNLNGEVSAKQVAAVMDATFNFIEEQMAKGKAVPITEFGTFSAELRAERTGRNPMTNESMVIPATVAPKFSAAAGLKRRLK